MIVSEEAFNQTVQEVMAQNKYFYLNNQLSQSAQSIWERIREWIKELLSSRISDLAVVEQTTDVICWVLIVIVVAALILTIILIAKKIYQNRKNRRVDEILGEKITDETTPVTLIKKAQKFEKEADYRLSIRYSYIGLLLLITEQRIIYIEKSMTNQEIYQSLEKSQFKELNQIKKLMNQFDATWYGHKSCSLEEYEQFKIEHKMIWNEVNTSEKKLG